MKLGQLIEYNKRNIFIQKFQGNLEYNKNKLYKTLDYRSRNILNFSSPEKGLGLVTPPHFEYDFSRKMILEILGNMCFKIDC